MTYGLVWSDEAAKDIKKLERKTAVRIVKRIKSIVENPFLFVRKLEGVEGLYRFRVGKYRVLMAVERGKATILIIGIDLRKRVYDRI
jgi:mRNA interferase RelE/StbE